MHATVLCSGGLLPATSEALPSPNVLVATYFALWLVLVVSMTWMAIRQHTVVRQLHAIEGQLQSRLVQAERAEQRHS